MGLDIYAEAEDKREQDDMEESMEETVGWTEPRCFVGRGIIKRWDEYRKAFDEHGREVDVNWVAPFEEATGLNINNDKYEDKDALKVHKMYINALKKPDLTKSGCEVMRWLEICCEYNASIRFSF